eukprot:TRINITY_DN3156_c0_g1_i1.p1 TRINITY_DN3156_c0_g1~~TRINITY_DN3156_c0_g1_i1.p1  ORF type:complete len:187 (-),score=54.27 TRINITY_DN3156_c0_g1_i1:124-627(-)
MLAQASADGATCVYLLPSNDHNDDDTVDDILELESIVQLKYSPSSSSSSSSSPSLHLSVDWSPETQHIGISHNSGKIAVWDLNIPDLPAYTWRAHNYEAWVVASSSHHQGQGHVWWSGGDDCMLRGWDTRMIDRYSCDNDGDDNGEINPSSLFCRRYGCHVYSVLPG